MGVVLTLAWKDLRLLFRDRMGLFFIVAFPVIMGVFFGLVNQSFSSSSEDRQAMRVGVVDSDRSEMSRRFLESLVATKNVEVIELTREDAIDRVRKGQLVGFIGVPAGFGKTAGIMWIDGPTLELGTDPSRLAESGMLQGMIQQAMGSLIQTRFSDAGGMRELLSKIDTSKEEPLVGEMLGEIGEMLGSIDAYQDRLGASGAKREPTEIVHIESVDVTRKRGENEELFRKIRSPWDISFPAAIMWGIMGCVAGFAISIVHERTAGTMLRLTVAPITRAQILAGKGLACFLAAIGVIVFMMTLGKTLGIQLQSPALLAVAIVCVASCFVGLMMLMSVIGKTEQAVGGAGWAIITLFCMFGGGMIPLAFLPGWMQTASNFSPVKWGILALEGAIWRGFTPAEMLLPCGVLLSIGAVAFTAGVTILSRQDP